MSSTLGRTSPGDRHLRVRGNCSAQEEEPLSSGGPPCNIKRQPCSLEKGNPGRCTVPAAAAPTSTIVRRHQDPDPDRSGVAGYQGRHRARWVRTGVRRPSQEAAVNPFCNYWHLVREPADQQRQRRARRSLTRFQSWTPYILADGAAPPAPAARPSGTARRCVVEVNTSSEAS